MLRTYFLISQNSSSEFGCVDDDLYYIYKVDPRRGRYTSSFYSRRFGEEDLRKNLLRNVWLSCFVAENRRVFSISIHGRWWWSMYCCMILIFFFCLRCIYLSIWHLVCYIYGDAHFICKIHQCKHSCICAHKMISITFFDEQKRIETYIKY